MDLADDSDFQLTRKEWSWFMEEISAFDVKSVSRGQSWVRYSVVIMLDDGVELFDLYNWDNVMRAWK